MLAGRTIRRGRFVFLDLEMTGLDPERDRICEIALVVVDDGELVEEFATIVKTDAKMSPGALGVHGITSEMMADKPVFGLIADKVRGILGDAVVVSHNVHFDLGYLHREFEALGAPLQPPLAVDTLLMARRLFAFPKNNLAALCERWEVPIDGHHRALADARATAQLFAEMAGIIDPFDRVTVDDLNDLLGALAPNSPLRLRQQQQLREAFRKRITVWIDYQGTSDPREGLVHREIAVWKLKLPRVQGWCYLREAERVFRLDRIRELWPGMRPYEIPEFRARI